MLLSHLRRQGRFYSQVRLWERESRPDGRAQDPLAVCDHGAARRRQRER
jgi:hypothetical protein